jgi:acetyl esterase/lipase
MDIYEPVGDDDNGPRPVMLVFHSGNFLPFPSNNGTGGDQRDSVVVEVCTQLAQRGYVAAAVDYRKGWNPVDPHRIFVNSF